MLHDEKPLPLSEILAELNRKFTSNLQSSAQYAGLAQSQEVQGRRFCVTRNYLEEAARRPHEKAIAVEFDEIFGDSISSLYLAFCGLDNPARMLTRRALELGLVLICYWDRPAEYWGWKSHDDDVSFSKLLQYLNTPGYLTLLDSEGNARTGAMTERLATLPSLYSKLSNVVHPKPYHFETGHPQAFEFTEADLRKTLALLLEAQAAVLDLLISRFPLLQARFDTEAPLIQVSQLKV